MESAMSGERGAEWFEALYDSDEEAKAQHALHVSRIEFARRSTDEAYRKKQEFLESGGPREAGQVV